MRQSSIEMVTEVINNTCTELIQQLRRQFQDDGPRSVGPENMVQTCTMMEIQYESRAKIVAAVFLFLSFAVY